MLITISGGKEGIKEYLEKGQKSGREFSRDELDERIILDGDLEFAHQLITEMKGDAERYLHITLAFKEDAVSDEYLRMITAEFKEFTFSAYGTDEFHMYAEAHIPKIKSYLSRKTGELIERKPHIHIVIPKTNLLSGTVVNPFGLVERNVKFIDAFQEHINNKLGLASPKNNRRLKFTNESDMIQRLKDDTFDGHNKEVKQAILAEVLGRQITGYAEFEALIAEFGEIKTRNKGKDTAYHNVKPAGHAKGINLKDYAFSREFIALPTAEKHRRLTVEIERKYETEGIRLKDPELIQTTLAEWHRFRAKEIKYINSGNKRLYDRYNDPDATPEWKEAILTDQASKFYQHYRKPDDESRKQSGRNPFEHTYGYKQLERNSRGINVPAGRAGGSGIQRRFQPDALTRKRMSYDGDREYDTVSLAHFEKTSTLDRVRTLPGLDMVRHPGQPEVLLPPDARDQLEHRGAGGDAALRRNRHSERERLEATGRETDTVVSQYSRDFHEERQQQDAVTLAEFRHIRKDLDAHRLLAELAISHGVIIEKYPVSQAADGSGRIQCGTRKYNVSDFLTREIRLSWDESAGILRESFLRQLAKEPVSAPVRNPTLALWREFQEYLGDKSSQHQTMTDQYANERARLLKTKLEFRQIKMAAASMPVKDRNSILAVARMNYLIAEAALKQAHKSGRAGLRVPISLQYQDYLQARASTGDEMALNELRRMKSKFEPDNTHTTNSIQGTGHKEERNQLIYRKKEVKFVVLKNGDVVYILGGRHILRDDGYKLHLLELDRLSIETGLRLAIAKFEGQSIVLNGSREFKERAARIAAETDLKLVFKEAGLNSIMQLRLSELNPGLSKAMGSPILENVIEEVDREERIGFKKPAIAPLRSENDWQSELDQDR